jgi:hypothetical protein
MLRPTSLHREAGRSRLMNTPHAPQRPHYFQESNSHSPGEHRLGSEIERDDFVHANRRYLDHN